MTEHPTCPVCRRPHAGEARCAACGWQMTGPLLLGGAGEDLLAAHERALAETARRWDAAAATRAARVGDSFSAYAKLLRNPDDAGPVDLPAPAAGPAADLTPLLAKLVAGDLPVLHFVEFGPDEATRVSVTADRAGVPAVAAPAFRLPWSPAVLGADRLLRRFRLAGGVGHEPIDQSAFDDVTARSLGALLPDDGAIVLVARHPGWTLLERSIDLARRRRPPDAELTAPAGDPLSDVVTGLLAGAPLAYDYVLLGAALDEESGRIDLVEHTVFPAGTVVPAGRPLTREVGIFGPPVAAHARTVTLPLLARRGADPAEWPILRLPRAELGVRAAETLTVTLAGPGRLHCSTGNGELAVDGPETMAAGLRQRTTRLPVPPPLDVVFLVELCGGSQGEVRARLEVLLRTVDALAERYAGRGDLQVGALGYYDHVVSEAPADRQREQFRELELGDPDVTRTQVAAWRPAQRQRDYATAVGDALAKAARMRWRRGKPGVEHAVLLIGRRPPEARRGAGDHIPLCPKQIDWRVEDHRLRSMGARRMARIDLPPDWPGVDEPGRRARAYAEGAWRTLGADGLFREDSRPEDLADLLSRRPNGTETWVFPFPFLTPLRGGTR